jgi:hypothetical protein
MNYDITFNGIYLSKIPIPGTSFVCKNLYTVCGNTSPNNIGDMFSVNGEYFILIRNNYGKLALKVS